MRVILHGGYGGWEGAGEDRVLFQKLIAAAEQANKRVLFSFLAYEKPSNWPLLDKLRATFQDMNPAIELLIAGRDNFADLLPQSQVLFLQGGSVNGQYQALADISKDDLIRDKVMLGGSSSGAMMLCQYGRSRSSEGIVQGKGVVDLAIMPHADAWKPEDQLLPKFLHLKEQIGNSVFLLNENEIVEINLD